MFGALVIISVGVLTAATDVVRAAPRALPEGMKLYKTAMMWEDAERTCRSAGTVLASPINDKAIHVMKYLMGLKNTTYFIGINSTYYGGPFMSVEGVRLEDMSLDVLDMIDVIDQRDGDCLAMNSDTIRAVSCSSLLPFMCYNTTNCGPEHEGYKYNAARSSCYKIHSEQTHWEQAEQTCILEGGHLVVIDNMSEAHYILEMMNAEQWVRTWIGLRELTGYGDWVSVHGNRVEDLFNIWWNGTKPQDKSLCGQFHGLVLGWKTCSQTWPFICEKISSK